MRRMRLSSVAVVMSAALAAAGCDDGMGPGTGAPVAVAFTAASQTGSASMRSGDGWSALLAAESLTLQGSNGTLVIEELHVIVEEFELDRLDDDACDGIDDDGDSDGVGDDDCEEFETGPIFVNVPLDGGEVVAVNAQVTPDTYDELDFEIEDLDDDTGAHVQLLSEIRATFPDWPRDASMLAVGTFTPTGGEAIPFRVYFEAEVEIEMDLVPPVTVTEADGGTFTVTLDPAFWFGRPDGTVWNLAQLDYDATGSVVEFEVEIENGFVEVEFDD